MSRCAFFVSLAPLFTFLALAGCGAGSASGGAGGGGGGPCTTPLFVPWSN